MNFFTFGLCFNSINQIIINKVKRLIFIALGVTLAVNSIAKTANQQGKYYHYYGGNDSINITLDIWQLNDTIKGYLNYCLDSANISPAPIPLGGYIFNDTLLEFYHGRTNELVFNGVLTDSISLSGHWFLKGDTISLSIKENYEHGSSYFSLHEITSVERLVDTRENPKAEIRMMLLFPDTLSGSLYSDTARKIIATHFWKKYNDNLMPDAILKQIVDEYFKQYTDGNREIYDEDIGNSFNWLKEKEVNIVFNHDSLLSLRYIDYAYTGGAHGLAIQKLHSLDAGQCKLIKLHQVIDSSDYDTLSVLLEDELRSNFSIDSAESLVNFGFFMDTLIIPRNFLATSQGLLFLYNPYEIAPYAFGSIELFIPFTKLTKYIKNDAFIRRFTF